MTSSEMDIMILDFQVQNWVEISEDFFHLRVT